MIHGKTILALIFAGTFAIHAGAAGFQLSPAAREKIETEAQRLIDTEQTPGLAIGIMSEGKIIYSAGFGLANLETGTRVTPDSVFVIGSNTKQFTAVAIMLLSEQGKLRLDDRLSKYFPDFPRGDDVTLRHLLTHSSGIHPVMIPGGLPTPEQRARLRTAADLVPIIQGQIPLYDFEPGTSRKYSNSGYIILGVVIEKVSGLSLGEFFKRNLFDRAGMTASALDHATEVVPHRASGYGRAPDTNTFINPPSVRDIGTGGGGIRSTVGDMLRWQEAFLSGRIISMEGVIAMTTPAAQNGEPFGVQVGEQEGHAFLATGGGGPGFRSAVKIFPDDRVALVIMTNSGAPQTPRISDPAASPSDQPEPPRKKGPGKKGPGSGQRLSVPPNPVRELEQVVTQLIIGGQDR